MSKIGIYACKNVVETCWKHGEMILRYLRYSFFFSTAAKFMRMSSACGKYQVGSQARACYVTQFTNKS